MNHASAGDQPQEPGWLRLEPVFLQFEEAWRAGAPPGLERLASTLPAADRIPVLKELVKIDLEYRWRRGERPGIDAYLTRFPELGDGPNAPSDLVREELRVRREYENSAPKPDGDTRLPRRLGRYELQEEVGHGGFATVFRGWDPELQRTVAIKVPRREHGMQPEIRARILREAQSAARLRHPAVVPIYEVGE